MSGVDVLDDLKHGDRVSFTFDRRPGSVGVVRSPRWPDGDYTVVCDVVRWKGKPMCMKLPRELLARVSGGA